MTTTHTDKPDFETIEMTEPLSFEELAQLSNDELDSALTTVCFARFGEDSRVAGDLWAERTRRIRRQERANLEAEEAFFDFGDEPEEGADHRAARFVAKHGNTMSMVAAAHVSCPRCKVGAGSKCKAAHGDAMERRVHTERVRAYWG